MEGKCINFKSISGYKTPAAGNAPIPTPVNQQYNTVKVGLLRSGQLTGSPLKSGFKRPCEDKQKK